jgi:16S rRNA (uracil1498-N3)-methyltransferase
MTRRRWIADEVYENTAALTGEHAFHLGRVLRAQIGQEFEIATGSTVRSGRITSISDRRIEFALGAESGPMRSVNLTLVLAIFKFDRMEWAIEKCTEIGVSRIIPLAARRTDSHLAAAAVKRQERWHRIARQASEQARRSAPPQILPPVKLRNLNGAGGTTPSQGAADAPANRIVLAESGSDIRLRDVLETSRDAMNSEVMLAIGPEGGWTRDELNWFRESGWTAASLGDNILRAETAAIVATALALGFLRQF